MSWAQVWDLPPIVLAKAHYLLPRRRCGCCGKITTAAPPWGAAGNVTYGPNVNAAAILLVSEGNVPLERTAHLMAALLGAPVSTGFVARALQRLAQRLTAAGFDESTPDTTSPNASTTRPSRSGPSPETSPCPEQTMPVSRPSKAPNDIRLSSATGTP